MLSHLVKSRTCQHIVDPIKCVPASIYDTQANHWPRRELIVAESKNAGQALSSREREQHYRLRKDALIRALDTRLAAIIELGSLLEKPR